MEHDGLYLYNQLPVAQDITIWLTIVRGQYKL